MSGMRIISWSLIIAVVFSCLGCEAFVRKFTRKPKKDKDQQQEMVLEPQEYQAPQLTREEQYRQYLLYWKSWQDELIEAFSGTNRKKQIDCAQEALNNLYSLKQMLNTKARDRLSLYIGQLEAIRDAVEKDPYGNKASLHRAHAERIRANILREFSYQKIKDQLL